MQPGPPMMPPPQSPAGGPPTGPPGQQPPLTGQAAPPPMMAHPPQPPPQSLGAPPPSGAPPMGAPPMGAPPLAGGPLPMGAPPIMSAPPSHTQSPPPPPQTHQAAPPMSPQPPQGPPTTPMTGGPPPMGAPPSTQSAAPPGPGYGMFPPPPTNPSPVPPLVGAPTSFAPPAPPQQVPQPHAPAARAVAPPPKMGGTASANGAAGYQRQPAWQQAAYNHIPQQTVHAAPPAKDKKSGTASRIDPNQIPRPPSALGHDPQVFETRGLTSANVPPPATSCYLVRDMGNCSPRNMRATLNQFPATGDLLSSSNMPLALVVQPLALLEPGEEPVQVVDFGEAGPLRCGRCKAYVNPFFRFVDAGRRYQCNLCAFINDCPRDYQCSLGPDGRRQDVHQRPELSKGSVEFVAPAEYMVRAPMPPAFFFVIDVTYSAIASGACAAVCSSIARTLQSIPGGDSTQVGIVTFDSTVHFYNMMTASGQPQMLVVGEVEEPYMPVGSGLLVSLHKYQQGFTSLLESIPTMFQASANPHGGSCMGAAVKGVVNTLKATGGKVMIFQTSICSVGVGAQKAREGVGAAGPQGSKLINPVGSTDDKAPLKTVGGAVENPMFRKLAQEAADHQICMDLFLLTQGHVDLATHAILTRTTGGDVHHYHPFSFSMDAAQLYNDVHWNLVRPQGMEGVMRVRCSTGLSVASYSGAYCKHTPTDLDLPAVDCNKAFLATLRHDEKLPDGQEAAVQCALLYTTMAGERRIRVHTLSLPTTSVLGNLFRSADLDVQLHAHVSAMCAQLLSGTVSLQSCREQMVKRCVDTLYSYRKFCATTSSSGQLILPEALKLLPLYTLASQKSMLLRSEVPADVRVRWASTFISLSAPFVVPRIYPRMFSVHNLLAEKEARTGPLPSAMALSSEKLEASGVYLIENGLQLLLWVGRQCSDAMIQELFGVQDLAAVQSGSTLVMQGEGGAVTELNAVLNEVRRQRCAFLSMRVAKRGDPLEVPFFNMLVEDRSQGGMSYVEFLCHIHRQIQNKFN